MRKASRILIATTLVLAVASCDKREQSAAPATSGAPLEETAAATSEVQANAPAPDSAATTVATAPATATSSPAAAPARDKVPVTASPAMSGTAAPPPTTTSGASPWTPPTTTAPAPPVPVVEPVSKPVATGNAASGASIYAAKCASCHGVEARGDTAIARKYGAADFRSPQVRALTSTDLAQIMKLGKGKLSEGAHPKAKLSDQDVRDMVAFIQSLK